MPRADWLAELEEHWHWFKDAGWVEPVTYKAYTAATDAVAPTGQVVDAIAEEPRKVERDGPDGSKLLVVMRRYHLRARKLTATVTKRGTITHGSDTWVVEEVTKVEDNEWVADCKKL